jgi:ketosteroid isomerase-like protein
MSEHPNITRVRAGYEAFSKGDFAALDALFAEDIRWHEPAGNQLSGDYQGRAAVYQFFGRLGEVTEGSLRIDLRSVLADDDTAVAIAQITARRGDRSFDVTNAHIFRFTGEQVTEFWETSGDQHAVDAVFG